MPSLNEIFKYSTVKKVIFQIRYPNLFFIENKIGEYQLQIIDKFPDSSLLFRRPMVVTSVGPDFDYDKFKESQQNDSIKIWNFKNEKGFALNVTYNSLDISSDFHKTYALEGAEEKFRDIIKLVVDSFLKVMAIPTINRIGFRYIDECPITKKNNTSFKRYYNTCFPLKRFPIDNADEMNFRTVIRKDSLGLIYSEALKKVEDEYKLILDFDGYAENIKSAEYLPITDKLHDLICDEFKTTMKEPAINYMRTGKIK